METSLPDAPRPLQPRGCEDASLKPSILFVDQSGAVGGAELMLADIASSIGLPNEVLLFADGPFRELLQRRSIDVTVSASSLRTTKDSGIFRSMMAIPNTSRLAVVIANRSRQHDVVYANTPKAFVLSAFASFLTRKPLVYHLHDILDSAHFSRSNIKLLVKLANRTANLVIANSVATADAFVKAGGRRDKVQVVYNGFNPATYATVPDDARLAIRDGFKLDRNAKVVLMVGRIARWKGQEVAIAALKDCNEWTLWIVGEAMFTDDDRAYKQELERLAEDPALVGRVRFLGFRDDLPELYAACDAVLHCSTAPEPFGRVIVEAMLANRPVIAAAAGGATEIVTHEKTGWLVKPKQSSDISDLLQLIDREPQLAARIAQAGKLEALQRFSIDAIITQIRACISSITPMPKLDKSSTTSKT